MRFKILQIPLIWFKLLIVSNKLTNQSMIFCTNLEKPNSTARLLYHPKKIHHKTTTPDNACIFVKIQVKRQVYFKILAVVKRKQNISDSLLENKDPANTVIHHAVI